MNVQATGTIRKNQTCSYDLAVNELKTEPKEHMIIGIELGQCGMMTVQLI